MADQCCSSDLDQPYVPPAIIDADDGTGTGGDTGTGGGGTGPGSGGGTGGNGEEWQKFSLYTPDIESITDALGKVTKGIQKINDFLKPILAAIELFINTFASFSKILEALFDLAQFLVDKAFSSSATAGVYVNVIVPPSLLKDSSGSIYLTNLSTGGFDGFLSRLDMSLKDTKDPQRPPFDGNAYVGGLLIAADSESPDAFFRALEQLYKLFSSFLDKFSISIIPPPPRNIRAYPGYFKKDGEEKYGIKLEWDPAAGFILPFMVSRSKISGGTRENDVPLVPKKLTGEDGLLNIVKKLIAERKQKNGWPTHDIYVYEDPDFNGGKPLLMSPNVGLGGGEYTDFLEPPLIKYENGRAVPDTEYPLELFYMVQAVAASPIGLDAIDTTLLSRDILPGAGEKPQETRVEVRLCNNSSEVTQVIQHATGVFEFLAPGIGKFGSWSSVQVSVLMPWMDDIKKILTKYIDQFKGMVVDASDSFSDFVQKKIDAIEDIVGMVNILTIMIEELGKLLVMPPSVSFLNVPAEDGGPSNFMQRVRNAEPPEGESFSGASGMTAGICLVYGATNPADFAAAKAAIEALSALFEGD